MPPRSGTSVFLGGLVNTTVPTHAAPIPPKSSRVRPTPVRRCYASRLPRRPRPARRRTPPSNHVPPRIASHDRNRASWAVHEVRTLITSPPSNARLSGAIHRASPMIIPEPNLRRMVPRPAIPRKTRPPLLPHILERELDQVQVDRPLTPETYSSVFPTRLEVVETFPYRIRVHRTFIGPASASLRHPPA